VLSAPIVHSPSRLISGHPMANYPPLNMDDQQIQDETRTRAQLIRDARAAARKAAREGDAEHSNHSQQGGWRNMWIALAVAGAVLLLLKLRVFL
jgi:anti-sigma-K factor RskA